MDQSFDPADYAAQVGRELVASFEGAGLATTPGQVGSAREVPIREKLEQMLPTGIGVGSGFVIDSFGRTSRQIDVILYEKNLCPRFCINRDEFTSFYPCEGVFAVGEIKSVLNVESISDIFEKVYSVKDLKRFSGNPEAFRKYGSQVDMLGVQEESFSQSRKVSDQIFGFGIGKDFQISPRRIGEISLQNLRSNSAGLCPNLIIGLDGGLITPLEVPEDRHNPKIAMSFQEANSVYFVGKHNDSFRFLLSRLYTAYRTGRTVETAAFDRYFANDGTLTLPSDGALFEFS